MSKKMIVVMLIVLLAGGGMAFAQYGPGNLFPGTEALPFEIDEDAGEEFGQQVSGLAQSGVLDDENEFEEKGEDERSEVAEAVLDVLGGGEFKPEDGEDFGQAVAEQAQQDGKSLGEKVSGAAREAAAKMGAYGR